MSKRVIIRRGEAKPAKEAEPFDTSPPPPPSFLCVVRDKMFHTALRLREDGEYTYFIPLKPEGFKLERMKHTEFALAFPIEETTYPVERCAKLYAGYGRSLGIEEPALRELAKLTAIDPQTKAPVTPVARTKETIVIGRKVAK